MIGDFDLIVKLSKYKFYHIVNIYLIIEIILIMRLIKKKLHITELKKWYYHNKFNEKYKMKIKKYFLPKIIYLKCVYNLDKSEYNKFFLI